MGLASEFKRSYLGEVAGAPKEQAIKALDELGRGNALFFMQGGNLWQVYQAATKLSMKRVEKYKDFDIMEEDSLLASALEMITDDACQMNAEKNLTIWPAEGSDKEWIESIFREIDVESRLWGWAYNMAKYGDYFLGINLEEDTGKFMGLSEAIHPKDVKRIDYEGKLAAFATVEEDKFKLKDPWQFVHFINNFKPTFEQVKIKEPPKGEVTSDPSRMVERSLTARYGTSVLEAARKVYKILTLLEQALALARLNRAPLIRVFYVNTENMTPEERAKTVDDLERHFKEKMAMDMRTNLYQSDFKPLSFNADIFIPYSGGKGDVRAETLGGEMNIKDIADINYLKNKLFAAIRIPQGFMGFEEALPGTLGSTTLTRLDIRYARMVKKIQRGTISGIQRLLAILYAIRNNKHADPKKLRVCMEKISGVEELDRMTGLERRISVAQQFSQLMNDLVEKVKDATPVYKYVFEDILGLGGLNIEFKKPEEQPAPEEGEGGTPKRPTGRFRFAGAEGGGEEDLLAELVKEENGLSEDTERIYSDGAPLQHMDDRAAVPAPKEEGGTIERMPEFRLVEEEAMTEAKDE